MLNNDTSIKKGSAVPTPNAAPIKPFSEETKKLQQEINAAIKAGHIPGPALKEDGLEGPKTREKLAAFQAYQAEVAKPVEPAKPAEPAPNKDQVVKRDPTVGEYVEGQVKAFGEELKTDAQVAAITAVAAPLVAVIEARHLSAARERIAKLPMDPEGKWKDEANKILKAEQAAAKAEILALPHKAGEAVVDGAKAAGDWANHQVDAAGKAAEYVWGQATHGAGQAWAYAKEAVPKAFKTVTEDAAVAAIALNPIGAIPSAQIVSNHMAAAYDRIMKLPMDPEGHWKTEAARITAEEQAKAKEEILALPGKAYHGVVDTATGVYTSARNGLVAAGQWVGDTATAAGKAVTDTVDAGYELAKKGVKETRHGIGGFFGGIGGFFGGIGSLFQRFGKWLAGD